MVKFVKEIPPKNRYSPWVERLAPLVQRPQTPALVFEAESAEQAKNHVDNLTRRLVIIPHPNHNWAFHSRGHLVFAIYKGKGRPDAKRVRRAK